MRFDERPNVGRRVRLVHFHVQPESTFRAHPSNPGVRPASNGEFYQDDNLLVPAGTEGTVTHVDDGGSLHIAWDNGSTLALLPEFDKWAWLS